MTATKIGRGFHRLALFLAAIPLLLGGSLSVYIAFDLANRLWEQHQKLVCAHEHVAGQKPGPKVGRFIDFIGGDPRLDWPLSQLRLKFERLRDVINWTQERPR
jgi:hypothetical protein